MSPVSLYFHLLVHRSCSKNVFNDFFKKPGGRIFHDPDLCFRKYGHCGRLNNNPLRGPHSNH